MIIFSLSGLSESSLDGSNGTPSISKVSSEISIGKRCTGPKCLLIDSIRSVVHGKKKYILENWVSKAPDSYCIRCLLKKVPKNYLVYAFYDGNEESLIVLNIHSPGNAHQHLRRPRYIQVICKDPDNYLLLDCNGRETSSIPCPETCRYQDFQVGSSTHVLAGQGNNPHNIPFVILISLITFIKVYEMSRDNKSASWNDKLDLKL